METILLENIEVYVKQEDGFEVCGEITGHYQLLGDFGNTFSLVSCRDEGVCHLIARR